MQDNDNEILDKYIGEICKEQVLTEAEEQELSAKARQGDSRALNKLVTANLRFVVSVANKYRGRGLAVEDLVSEGNIALIKAAAKFDASRSRFVSYAVPIVRRSMERAIEAQGEHYPVQSGVARADRSRGKTMSVDAPLGGRDNVNLLSLLVNPNAPDADELMSDRAQNDYVARTLDTLDERERKVISGCFGVGCTRMTLAEIAENMGLKRERVRQIRDKAVRKLGKKLKTRHDR